MTRPVALPLAPARADHGGGIDAARARWGGDRAGWIDLSTGINPHPYPLPPLSGTAWTTLPDDSAQTALTRRPDRTWSVPEAAAIVAAPGTSALIARLPALGPVGTVRIPGPTYNEHARAFTARAGPSPRAARMRRARQPQQPGRPPVAGGRRRRPHHHPRRKLRRPRPRRTASWPSRHAPARRAQGTGQVLGPRRPAPRLRHRRPRTDRPPRRLLGPWAVSGPALAIGTAALRDPHGPTPPAPALPPMPPGWTRCSQPRAPHLWAARGFTAWYAPDAARWQARLARHHIWTRLFLTPPPGYASAFRGPNQWVRLATALKDLR